MSGGENPFSVERQTAAVQAGEWTARKRAKQRARLDQRYAAALDELAIAESKLARALTRWQKARHKLRRLDRELDKLREVDADAGDGGDL